MKKLLFIAAIVAANTFLFGQDAMTPEMLIQLGKVSAKGITKDGKSVIYSVKKYSLAEDKNTTKQYIIPIDGGTPTEWKEEKGVLPDNSISPDGKYSMYFKDVKLAKVTGKDYYPDLKNSNVLIYDDLAYRHWDTYEDGSFSHVFIHSTASKDSSKDVDIMVGEPFDCPQKPFGGDEDVVWSSDSKELLYVTKKLSGKKYALSTNTEIYAYSIETGTTRKIEGTPGYDMNPAFNSSGTLAWLSMARDGFEADKNDIMVVTKPNYLNVTKDWDGTVTSFRWSNDGKKIYFVAPIDGTEQLFEANFLGIKTPIIKQITKGDFDITSMVAQTEGTMVVTRTDMNHATEIFTVELKTGKMKVVTKVNEAIYYGIHLSRVESRMMTTTDNKQMLVWIIYPPNFDASKKYPTLLYCQGGPQSALSQFYSFRWNFQLMAANGYIIVAPNRRGMPGHGVEWNASISKHYGEQAMSDYLTAIDEFSKEPFVDKTRLGCIGASFGGYSVYYLAGHHNNRFKTFIAHDGIFDWKSMYGTTEEMWFTNWDLGGPYWNKSDAVAQKSFNEFNPINSVDKWNTPILIIQGAKDYRVPIEQGLQAFQAAQLKGIKSKLLLFPEENHWVLNPQNSLVWQREFYKWLKETL